MQILAVCKYEKIACNCSMTWVQEIDMGTRDRHQTWVQKTDMSLPSYEAWPGQNKLIKRPMFVHPPLPGWQLIGETATRAQLPASNRLRAVPTVRPFNRLTSLTANVVHRFRQDGNTTVKTEYRNTDWLKPQQEVRQGCPPYHFNLSTLNISWADLGKIGGHIGGMEI
ncbi:hypothetical protein LAZ67_17003098 [Cordylochernes scorpioides]|uniref:Uncharacterized protein n=1 Tax=Cordylochernes scorpioides TaxID=51811 RepID=A0ABY6LFC9_9ARAC|nr:hypothetical protein LAZ67_17003098 [Cordylochernes scorpioides]